MNWVNRHKLPAIETIKHNSQSYLNLNNLWNALHLFFNMAQYHCIEEDILNEIPIFASSSQLLFSEEEFTSAIVKCNNLSTPSLDKLAWRHLKHILKNKSCLKNIIDIANVCLNIGYWPFHFKILYDSPKLFRLIVYLNTRGKLVKKIISDRLQFQVISNNFIHQSQLGGLKFKSTTNTGIALTYFIHMGWIRNIPTSILTFDISQFFLSLNHCLLTLILEKAGFNSRVVKFFSNYLVSRRTQYFWNSFSLPFFNVNVGVGQGLALSPILSALYLASFLHILENHLKNLKISVSMLSFINDGLLVAQNKSISFSNSLLFCSYNIISNLLSKFSLLVEYSKIKVFHFSRLHGQFNSFSRPFPSWWSYSLSQGILEISGIYL